MQRTAGRHRWRITLSRVAEVILVFLLVVVTLGLALQWQNQQMLREVLSQLRSESRKVTLTEPTVTLTPGKPAVKPAAMDKPDKPAMTAPPLEPVTTAPEVAAAPSSTPDRATVEPAKPDAAPTEPTAATTTSPTKPDAAPAPVNPEDEKAWTTFGPTVEQFVQQLMNGDYDAVVKRFNAHMAANLTKSQLAAIIDPIRQQHGSFKALTRHAVESDNLPPEMHVFNVGVELNDGHALTLTITLDDKQRVTGLLMK
ncbi:MAG: DUF3887 domain-containing protein [Planctomycetes bacterium]|nr:DUF3887 domain-containing protein [Planctomycetota bacterium]